MWDASPDLHLRVCEGEELRAGPETLSAWAAEEGGKGRAWARNPTAPNRSTRGCKACKGKDKIGSREQAAETVRSPMQKSSRTLVERSRTSGSGSWMVIHRDRGNLVRVVSCAAIYEGWEKEMIGWDRKGKDERCPVVEATRKVMSSAWLEERSGCAEAKKKERMIRCSDGMNGVDAKDDGPGAQKEGRRVEKTIKGIGKRAGGASSAMIQRGGGSISSIFYALQDGPYLDEHGPRSLVGGRMGAGIVLWARRECSVGDIVRAGKGMIRQHCRVRSTIYAEGHRVGGNFSGHYEDRKRARPGWRINVIEAAMRECKASKKRGRRQMRRRGNVGGNLQFRGGVGAQSSSDSEVSKIRPGSSRGTVMVKFVAEFKILASTTGHDPNSCLREIHWELCPVVRIRAGREWEKTGSQVWQGWAADASGS
ncbi:hypothetical protein DFH06DRAFT_1132530 [Mycena polygramma]|nr:hypothetical protein DFH06DRAFT_1132530 [Mycena polygramma]